jgi:hypothetical protein
MKTAIEQILIRIEKDIKQNRKNLELGTENIDVGRTIDGILGYYQRIIKRDFIEKEKQQIYHAFEAGGGMFDDPEQYYEAIYTENK